MQQLFQKDMSTVGSTTSGAKLEILIFGGDFLSMIADVMGNLYVSNNIGLVFQYNRTLGFWNQIFSSPNPIISMVSFPLGGIIAAPAIYD